MSEGLQGFVGAQQAVKRVQMADTRLVLRTSACCTGWGFQTVAPPEGANMTKRESLPRLLQEPSLILTTKPLPYYPVSIPYADLDPMVVPTVGFSAPVTLSLFGAAVTFYDLGGGSRIRGVWPNYFADVHGVVYVVDSAEKGRLEESAHELKEALLHPMVAGKPVLV